MLTVGAERSKVFFDIQIGTRKEGRIFFELVSIYRPGLGPA